MPTFVSVKTTQDSNYVALAQAIANDVTGFNGGTTFFKVSGPDNASATFFGESFTYDENGVPETGTVKSISLKIGTVVIATVSGITIDVGIAAQAFLGGGFPALIGLFGDMRVTGNIGDDVLAAGSGDDIFYGGLGADSMFGTGGNDTVSYIKSDTKVTASLANPGINTGDAAGDTYGSIENLTGTDLRDRLLGNGEGNILDGKDGNDKLSGGAGGDILIGGNGGDLLTGGRGADILKGLDGADKFIFKALNEGGDEVVSFDSADKVRVKAAALGIDPSDFSFFASDVPEAPDASPAFLYDTDDKILIWDANGSVADGRTTLFTITGFGVVQSDDVILF